MGKKLTNNLGLKIISVFLAFFIWMSVVNISNPEITGTKEVPLEILNDEILKKSGKTYELLTDKNTVTVSYKVRTLDAGGISSADFRAYIDLADMYEPTGAVPVIVETKNNKVDSVVPKPGVVRVNTEDLQRKQFELSAYIEGNPEDGYKEGTVTLSPSHVYVSGPVSSVGRISSVGIVINEEGANSDLSGSAPVKFFDSNKNEIQLDDRVSLSRTEVDYELTILKVKNLGLSFETEGRVADGYRYTGIESNVNSVAVVGLKSDLAGVNSIMIPKSELNMDGVAGDKEVTINLEKYLPEGVEIVDSQSEITVTIKVEPLEQRTFTLPTSRIKQVGALSLYSYQYEQESIQVVVQGLKEDLDILTTDSLGAEVDVESMTPGTHTGEITFQLGAAYELVSYDSPQIIVHDKGTGPEAAGESETEASSGEAEAGQAAEDEG